LQSKGNIYFILNYRLGGGWNPRPTGALQQSQLEVGNLRDVDVCCDSQQFYKALRAHKMAAPNTCNFPAAAMA
jgi:hypothetical protein